MGVIKDICKNSTINFLKKANMIEGNKQEYYCSKCKSRGFFYIPKITIIEDKKERIWDLNTKKCDCWKIREEIRRTNKSGLGKYLNYRMKDFIATKEWQKNLKEKVIDYCFNHTEDSTWICLMGQSGTGKSLLASIVANNFLYNKKRFVKYIIWTDFISKFKTNLMGDVEEKEQAMQDLEEIKTVDILFVDELLKKYNEVDIKYVNEIINYRYANNLKTIITTERILSELIKIDEATFSRVYEMCEGEKFTIQIARDISKNYRLKEMSI